MVDTTRLTQRPPRSVIPVVAPSTTPARVALTAALDFGTATTTVGRSPRSLRRTSHLDALVSAGPDDGMVLSGAARDLHTDDLGKAHVVASASLRAHLDPDRSLRSLVTEPRVEVSGLLGRPVGRGFRAALDAAVPLERAARSPMFLLLDELAVILVISGYVGQFTEGGTANPAIAQQRDICSGFRHEGVMMQSFDATGALPISIGPVAGDLGADDDLAWHVIDEQVPGSMRRRRLVEIRHDAAGNRSFYGYFRDTYRASWDEREIVMHEYQIHGTAGAGADDGSIVVHTCVAEPLTLPWPECPHAAASAGWIVGKRVDQIRDTVRFDYRGTHICTHLNDLVRSLGDLDGLDATLSELPSSDAEGRSR